MTDSYLFEDYFIELLIDSAPNYKIKLKQAFDCKQSINLNSLNLFKFSKVKGKNLQNELNLKVKEPDVLDLLNQLLNTKTEPTELDSNKIKEYSTVNNYKK